MLHLLHASLRDHYDLHLYLCDRETQSSKKSKRCIRSLEIFFDHMYVNSPKGPENLNLKADHIWSSEFMVTEKEDSSSCASPWLVAWYYLQSYQLKSEGAGVVLPAPAE